MSKIEWDASGAHLYETGVDRGVLYPMATTGYGAGVPWNGLTALSESPSGAEATALYADNAKYLNLISAEEFSATLEAYTYPPEFEACNGEAEIATGVVIGQQDRKIFGLSYRTLVGNDVNGQNHGYKIHLIYGCQAAPSEKSYQTVNDSPDAINFSWEIKTTPVNVTGHKPTATLVIDSTKIVDAYKLTALEAILYGTNASAFDAESRYAVGDAVTKTEGEVTTVYVCKTAITTAGAWDATKWVNCGVAGPRLPLPAEVMSILG